MIIGLDVGGTHTDVVLLSEEGILREVKVPTDTAHLFHTVLKGLENITEGVDLQDVQRVVLSTTLATNAIIQHKIPEVGIIVSSGPGIDAAHFKPNTFYYPVAGSIDHRGREIASIDEDEIEAVGEELVQRGIRHLGVVGKFSVRNPSHEIRIQDILQNKFEKIFLGHRLSGNLNFPRRIATAFLNASVYPIHKEFFTAVSDSLKAKGIDLPIRILKADGGNVKFESSIDFPGQTILSGPAASVMGAVAFAPHDRETLVLDIGGTTTDMTVLVNGVPLLAPLGIDLGETKTLIRSMDVYSIGIGGDSLVRLGGEDIVIGPERLGPAMAYGGPVPTPTDALFVLGRMENGNQQKSIAGIAPIAAALNMTVEETAEKIFDLTCQKILSEATAMVMRLNRKPVYTIYELQEGLRLNPKDILILGGPAPLFAERIKQLSAFEVRVIPKWSVANAMGAALARTTCEVALFADSEQGSLLAPGEDYSLAIQKNFTAQDAIDIAYDLLKAKAIARGANPGHLDMELIENLQFNMVRGFSTTGKNIRIRAQVRPGLIHGYERIIQPL
ncbi:MAG: hydantoinase/oxoprolinase family protein [Deltaproteobacteria bacterium]